MQEVKLAKVLVALCAAGSLALATGLALAATTESKTPEPAKAPAAAPAAPAKAAGDKEAQESKAEQKAEKATAPGKTEKEVAADRTVRGEVTAVETTAKTLTVKTMRNKKEEIVGVEVPDTAKITQGKTAKALSDIKVGEHVWMKYDRMSDKLVADQIHILPPQKTAAKKKSS